MQVFSYFFFCSIALHFLLRNVEVRPEQSLTSSAEKEADSSAILSISVTRSTNSLRESLTSSTSWKEQFRMSFDIKVRLMNDIDSVIGS